MYRIIASDMDETFLDEAHSIPAANLEGLRRLHELGVLFVPCSGRGYLSIMDNFRGVDPKLMEGSYVLSYNGATLNRYGDPTPLYASELDHELADELWALGCRRGIGMHVYTPDGRVLVNNLSEGELSYVRGLRGFEDYPHDTLAGVPQVSKMLFSGDDFGWVHRFADEVVAPMLGELAEHTFSSGRYLEINPAGSNKGSGIRRLAEILAIPMEQVIAVGDSANDREMIEAAGLGVGVANVSEDARDLCDLVLETTGMEGALPELIDRVIVPSINA